MYHSSLPKECLNIAIVVFRVVFFTKLQLNTYVCRSADGAGKCPVGNVGRKTRLSSHPAGLQPNLGPWDQRRRSRRHAGVQRHLQQVSFAGCWVGLLPLRSGIACSQGLPLVHLTTFQPLHLHSYM